MDSSEDVETMWSTLLGTFFGDRPVWVSPGGRKYREVHWHPIGNTQLVELTPVSPGRGGPGKILLPREQLSKWRREGSK
jgi:hypothetical protein